MNKSTAITVQIEQKIYLVRGQKVMFDSDLAALYGASTKRLNEQVKRNLDRFPDDFMFQLTAKELNVWRSQIATSNPKAKMGLRRRPRVFTEMGVAMLSSVLHSDQAIQVNIGIMRTFTKLRSLIGSHADVIRRLNKLESEYDENFRVVFDAIERILNTPESPRKKIGFNSEVGK